MAISKHMLCEKNFLEQNLNIHISVHMGEDTGKVRTHRLGGEATVVDPHCFPQGKHPRSYKGRVSSR